jgi:DNA polymerase-4
VAERRGLTLVGLTVSDLSAAPVQLELPLPGCERARLDSALDELRERFGAGAVIRATLIGRGRGLQAHLLAGEEAR